MCDTLIALGNSTKDGSVVFGKNSDRPEEEVQLITYVPHTDHEKDEKLKCTYIEIPQASETLAVLLSQPWWMWGAEMGTNEEGVVIGNEAVYSHETLRSTGLLGMDLLRLGLERGRTAKQALNIITELLEKYHQGGGCSYGNSNWSYHNSFMIADPKEAYVLETADDWWVAEIVEDVRSISNSLTIRGKGDLRREGIISYAIEKGYCKDDDNFDFALTFSGSIPSTSPRSRLGKSTLLLKENKGSVNSQLMMDFLREHKAGLCMHGGFESTGSQVSQLRKGKDIHWFTGTTLPCISIYKPYVFPVKNVEYYSPGPYSNINSKWIWVQHSRAKFKVNDEPLRKLEQNIISEINALLEKEKSVSEEEFLQTIEKYNSKAWNQTEASLP